MEIEPECSISPMHKLIYFELDARKANAKQKEITYRTKTNFDAKEFIEKSLSEIREMEPLCNCDKTHTLTEGQTCVNCTIERSKTILTVNYNNRCPEITKNITIKETSKWFDNVLLEEKKRKRKMEDKWKRNKS